MNVGYNPSNSHRHSAGHVPKGFRKSTPDALLGFKETQHRPERPLSSATVFDTDFEDDVSDVEEFEDHQDTPRYVEEAAYGSDFEEDLDYPRLSYRSVCTTFHSFCLSY